MELVLSPVQQALDHSIKFDVLINVMVIPSKASMIPGTHE